MKTYVENVVDSKGMSTTEIYDAALIELDVKAGDYARVTKRWKDLDLGWDNVWDEDMDAIIGHAWLVVDKDYDRQGILLSCNYMLPPYCLEKVDYRELSTVERMIAGGYTDDVFI